MKGLLKADPVKEEPQPYIDCTGNLLVKFLKLSKIVFSFCLFVFCFPQDKLLQLQYLQTSLRGIQF